MFCPVTAEMYMAATLKFPATEPARAVSVADVVLFALSHHFNTPSHPPDFFSAVLAFILLRGCIP